MGRTKPTARQHHQSRPRPRRYRPKSVTTRHSISRRCRRPYRGALAVAGAALVLLPKPFDGMVQDILQTLHPDLKLMDSAVFALHDASEHFLTEVFQDAGLVAKKGDQDDEGTAHADKRFLQLARRIRGERS